MSPEVVRLAAVGDSFTEGVGDEWPDGSPRGWADQVAIELARHQPVEYLNLAVRGRLLEPIVLDQLEEALRQRPTLLTFNGGGNDLLRPKVSIDQLRRLTERAVIRCAEEGVQMVLLSGANPSAHLPLGSRIQQQGTLLTEAVTSLAQQYDLTFVNNFDDAELSRSVYWSPDRLHLGPKGHRRVAARVLTALGQEPPADWFRAYDGIDQHPSRRENVRYYVEHVGPWVLRRLRGRSSGDGRPAKFGTWHTVSAPDQDPHR